MSNKTELFKRLFNRKPAIHHIGIVVISWTLISEVHVGNCVHSTSCLTSCVLLFTLVNVGMLPDPCLPTIYEHCMLFLFFILFNDAVRFWNHIASMIENWMSMEQWWNDINMGKLKYSKKNLLHCHFVYHRHLIHWTGIVPMASAVRGERWTT
jgi:hypothetical protein